MPLKPPAMLMFAEATVDSILAADPITNDAQNA